MVNSGPKFRLSAVAHQKPHVHRMHEYGWQLKMMTIGTILRLLRTRLDMVGQSVLSVRNCACCCTLFMNLPHAVSAESRGATSSAYSTKR